MHTTHGLLSIYLTARMTTPSAADPAPQAPNAGRTLLIWTSNAGVAKLSYCSRSLSCLPAWSCATDFYGFIWRHDAGNFTPAAASHAAQCHKSDLWVVTHSANFGLYFRHRDLTQPVGLRQLRSATQSTIYIYVIRGSGCILAVSTFNVCDRRD